ncbi:TPA: hypothetical protein ACH3X1_010409 [Trebouxia sp. C0004]
MSKVQATSTTWACRGTIVHIKTFAQPQLLVDHIVIIGPTEDGGTIQAICSGDKEPEVCSRFDIDTQSIVRLEEGELLCPGFIDLHVHAPQYSYTGTATDRPVMEWLNTYAFPRETAHSDSDAATKEYMKLCNRLVAHGTTTVLIFGTIYKAACQRLALCLQAQGLRGFVGKVCMDRQSPDGYSETTSDSLADTEAFIKWVQQLQDDKIHAVVTPRFVPTCTPELLQGLGQLAAQFDTPIQSHISESFDEVEYSSALHPENAGGDTALFDKAGLLRQRAVMAHGTCLTDPELKVLGQRGTALAHCPLSNFFFGDRVLHVRHAMQLGVKIGLGTDVAGGYSPSMLNAMRSCVIASRALCMSQYATMAPQLQTPAPPQTEPNPTRQNLTGVATAASAEPGDSFCIPAGSRKEVQAANLLDWKGAFWLATVGGAQALGLEKICGTLEVGKAFDALRVDTRNAAAFDVFPADTPMDIFQKFVNLGDDRNIKAVWVGGKLVHQKAS